MMLNFVAISAARLQIQSISSEASSTGILLGIELQEDVAAEEEAAAAAEELRRLLTAPGGAEGAQFCL